MFLDWISNLLNFFSFVVYYNINDLCKDMWRNTNNTHHPLINRNETELINYISSKPNQEIIQITLSFLLFNDISSSSRDCFQ